MRTVFVIAALIIPVFSTSSSAGFLSSLMGRAVVKGSVAAVEAQRAAKVYGPDVLTVSQLSACIVSAKSLDAVKAELAFRQAALTEHKIQIEARMMTMQDERRRLNRGSRRSVNAFNEEVKSFNKFAEDINKKKDVFNNIIDQHKKSIESYNSSCVKKYYESDLEVAKKQADLR